MFVRYVAGSLKYHSTDHHKTWWTDAEGVRRESIKFDRNQEADPGFFFFTLSDIARQQRFTVLHGECSFNMYLSFQSCNDRRSYVLDRINQSTDLYYNLFFVYFDELCNNLCNWDSFAS